METKYKHLSCEERALIQLKLEHGCTLQAIACSVQRSPGTIHREVTRARYRVVENAPSPDEAP
jgi:IS30 family transposase